MAFGNCDESRVSERPFSVPLSVICIDFPLQYRSRWSCCGFEDGVAVECEECVTSSHALLASQSSSQLIVSSICNLLPEPWNTSVTQHDIPFLPITYHITLFVMCSWILLNDYTIFSHPNHPFSSVYRQYFSA